MYESRKTAHAINTKFNSMVNTNSIFSIAGEENRSSREYALISRTRARIPTNSLKNPPIKIAQPTLFKYSGAPASKGLPIFMGDKMLRRSLAIW